MVEVVLGGRSTLYHVYKRPFVDFFLRTVRPSRISFDVKFIRMNQVSGWYTLVIFTASMQEYADPVIDWLDGGRGILGHRLFRDVCFPALLPILMLTAAIVLHTITERIVYKRFVNR